MRPRRAARSSSERQPPSGAATSAISAIRMDTCGRWRHRLSCSVWPAPPANRRAGPAVSIGWVPSRVCRDPLRYGKLKEMNMASLLNPDLNFNGNARQAMEFYASVIGRAFKISPFVDYGAQGPPVADRVLH